MSYGSHNPAALRRGRKGRALPTAPAPSRWSNLRSGRPITFALAFALVAIGSASAMGEGLLSAGVRAARDAVNVMEDRSPGERTHASLSKGKPRIDVGRVARALPRIRDARVSTQPPATAETLPGAVAAPPGGAVPGLAAPAATATPVALAEAPVGGFVGGRAVSSFRRSVVAVVAVAAGSSSYRRKKRRPLPCLRKRRGRRRLVRHRSRSPRCGQ